MHKNFDRNEVIKIKSNNFQLLLPKLRNTNVKLLFILFFNTADGFFTFYGISNNYIIEMNRLMATFISNFNKLFIFKFIIPSLSLLLILYLINRYDFSKMYVAKSFINICLYTYIFVFILHLIWMGRLIGSMV